MIKSTLKNVSLILTAIVVLVISTAYESNAEEKTLNLDQAIEMALENNHDTKNALLEVEKAEAAIDEAYGYAYPTIDLSGQYYRFLEKPKMPFPDFEAMLGNSVSSGLVDYGLISEDDAKYSQMGTTLQSFSLKNNFEAKAELTQILFSSAVFTGIGASEDYYNLAKEQLKSTVNITVFNVKKTFYGVLLAQEAYDILNESYENAKQNLSNVKAFYEQGLAAEYDKMQAEIKVENIRPQLLDAENSLKNAKNGLKMIIGVDIESDLSLIGQLNYSDNKIADYIDLKSTALEDNFDIRSLRSKANLDQAQIELAESEYWPTLALFANASYNGQSDDFDFLTYSSAIVGLNLSINIYNGGRTFHKKQQQEISKMQTETQIHQIKEYLSMDIKTKLNEIEKVKSSLEAQERNVKLAEKAYTMSEVRYKEGAGSQLEVLNADIALKQAKTNRLKSVYEYITALAEIDKILGNVDMKYMRRFLSRKQN